jgi:integrase
MSPTVKLKYVKTMFDRHGHLRHYFRRAGFPSATLPGSPGDPAFMQAYTAALAGLELPRKPRNATLDGSIASAVHGYLTSLDFKDKAPDTQETYRIVLRGIAREYGDGPVASLKRKDIKKIVAKLLPQRGKARHWLKLLKILLKWCVDEGWIEDNPAAGIKNVSLDSEGHKPWPAEYIEKFRARHGLGSMARLALELLIATASRRMDALKLGRQHLQGGVITFRPNKTRRRTNVEVPIPVPVELQRAIDAMPSSTGLTFIHKPDGTKFSKSWFGDWFRERAREAGIPDGYTPHGLRKSTAERIALASATAPELMSFGGWSSMTQADEYIRKVNRKKLAAAAAKKLAEPAPSAPAEAPVRALDVDADPEGNGPERER